MVSASSCRSFAEEGSIRSDRKRVEAVLIELGNENVNIELVGLVGTSRLFYIRHSEFSFIGVKLRRGGERFTSYRVL